MRNEARTLLTRNSLGFRTMTCPIVGRSVLGRITAAATWKVKALEFAVEKTAEQGVRLAPSRWFSRVKGARLEPESNRRAAPGRTGRLPVGSVRNWWLGKMAVLAEAFPAPS